MPSFVDYWGMIGQALAGHPDLVCGHFGGTLAPEFRLRYDGDRVLIAGLPEQAGAAGQKHHAAAPGPINTT